MATMTAPDDRRVALLRAVADPNRLAVLLRLASEGPVCACDLGDCCDVSQPTLSHHLKVLREAGWIEGERRGTSIWYSIRPQAVSALADLVDRLGAHAGRPTPTRSKSLPVLQPA